MDLDVPSKRIVILVELQHDVDDLTFFSGLLLTFLFLKVESILNPFLMPESRDMVKKEKIAL